jgi:hypothetical protein
MRMRARLARLERRDVARGAGDGVPPVEIWMPENGRDGRPPGRYPCPGGNAVLVIYLAGESPALRQDEA